MPRTPYGLVDLKLVGRAGLDPATLGLKVRAAPFQGSSVLADIRLYLRLRAPR